VKETQNLKMLDLRSIKDNLMETRITMLETRFDTILPTLATKEDLKSVEIQLTSMELKLTKTIHHEITSCTWKMISWMTAVVGMAFAGVFYIARYLPA
jgi:hypothetical protein